MFAGFIHTTSTDMHSCTLYSVFHVLHSNVTVFSCCLHFWRASYDGVSKVKGRCVCRCVRFCALLLAASFTVWQTIAAFIILCVFTHSLFAVLSAVRDFGRINMFYITILINLSFNIYFN